MRSALTFYHQKPKLDKNNKSMYFPNHFEQQKTYCTRFGETVQCWFIRMMPFHILLDQEIAAKTNIVFPLLIQFQWMWIECKERIWGDPSVEELHHCELWTKMQQQLLQPEYKYFIKTPPPNHKQKSWVKHPPKLLIWQAQVLKVTPQCYGHPPPVLFCKKSKKMPC